MRELIAKLGVTTEGSRELDKAIWLALGESPHRLMLCPEYTASIDAALTLVPNGWCWAVLRLPNGMFSAGMQKPPAAPLLTDDEFATPALALCVAALRAREAAHD